MNFKWDSEENRELFVSLKGIIKNDGFFKSAGQAAFFAKRVREGSSHIGPVTCWDNSVEVAEGQYALICEGTVGAGDVNYVNNWGRHARRKAWIFLMDDAGVVAMFIGRCKHFSDGSAPNGEKTVRDWVRADDGRAQELAQTWAEERAAKAKILGEKRAASTHVGEVGERIVVEGVARLVSVFDNAYGTSYMYLIDGADGNAYKFIGTGIHPREAYTGDKQTFSLKAKFTVKKHDEYNGQKQTVVNRPKVEVAEMVA
tara:strand:+ start:12236 stop:13006 length:771 start_codon:yes stop_codon:yes gene_type:complete